ncbi:MAG: hypothetical protein ACYC2H_09940 [Thermoplasmatota archaeon]
MPFTFALKAVVPAATLKKDAVRSAKVRLPSKCVVDSLILAVPAGHEGEAPVWVEVNGAQVMPESEGEGELRLDDATLELLAAPLVFGNSAELALAGYNDDAVNAHTTRLLAIGRYREDLTDEEAQSLGVL